MEEDSSNNNEKRYRYTHYSMCKDEKHPLSNGKSENGDTDSEDAMEGSGTKSSS